MSRTVYRGMIADGGLPLVARDAKALGVRVDGEYADVHPDEEGRVRPDEGMSVAPDDPYALPDHRRSEAFDGSAKFPTWSFALDQLPPQLHFVQDKLTHGVIGPAQLLRLTEYERHLVTTRSDWLVAR